MASPISPWIASKKLKSEKHHWWPRCVSQFWADEHGTTGRIKPDGSVIRVPPERLGSLRDGHHLRFGSHEEPHVWDKSFEAEFDAADRHFPDVIKWLLSLDHPCEEASGPDRYVPHECSDDMVRAITECVVSLAVRSPMNRDAYVALAEDVWGDVPPYDRSFLTGINMQRAQRTVTDFIGTRAKLLVLYSREHELIYGDGFFHNLRAVVDCPRFPKLVAPLTPGMALALTVPSRYQMEPQLTSVLLSDDEVADCNYAVQVYAKDEIFFRSEPPLLTPAFKRSEYLQYGSTSNVMDTLLKGVPGIREYVRKGPSGTSLPPNWL